MTSLKKGVSRTNNANEINNVGKTNEKNKGDF